MPVRALKGVAEPRRVVDDNLYATDYLRRGLERRRQPAGFHLASYAWAPLTLGQLSPLASRQGVRAPILAVE